MGLEKVRAIGITRNSINLVSTRDEMEHSIGKKESHAISLLDKGSDLGICTQFPTEDKYRFLVEINEALNSGLRIGLIEAHEAETSVFIPTEIITDDIKEGMLKEYTATRYERSHIARRLCLDHYGDQVACQICGFDFEKTYGKRENADPYHI